MSQYFDYEQVVETVPLGTAYKGVKSCSCGRLHYTVTIAAVICKEGYLWSQCECGSTMTFMAGRDALAKVFLTPADNL